MSENINISQPATQASRIAEVLSMMRIGDTQGARLVLESAISDRHSRFDCEMPALDALLKKLASDLSLPGQVGLADAVDPESWTIERYLLMLAKEYTRARRERGFKPGRGIDMAKVQPIVPVEGARPVVHWGDGRRDIIYLSKSKLQPRLDVESATSISEYEKALDSQSLLPVFNIVSPAFNAEKFIDATIQSVVTQEGHFEINYHVQDGGSTDRTLQKLSRWKKLLSEPHNPFVRCKGVNFSFSSESDFGMYHAIQKGFSILDSGEETIQSWINADDALVSGAFSTVLKIFQSNKDSAWIIGAVNGCNEHQEELSMLSLHYPTEIIRNGLCEYKNWSFIQQEGSFWRSSLWRISGGVNTRLKLCGDWDLWRRFAEHTNPIHVTWPLGRFRIHGAQLSTNIESYYQEVATVISEADRVSAMDNLLDRRFDSLRVVERPFGRVDSLPYALKPLSESNIQANTPRHKSSAVRLLNNLTSNQKLRVLTLCTLASGGAGTGSLRRVEALRNIGIDVDLLALSSSAKYPYVGRIQPTLDSFDTSNQEQVWRILYQNLSQKVCDRPDYQGFEMFSLPGSLLTADQLRALIANYDLVHLHWVVGMIDVPKMATIFGRKPIVWTTADMNPFTGGCHYSEGCLGFTEDCGNCVMIGESKLAGEAWQHKHDAYKGLNLSIICPSRYIAALASRSSLFGKTPIHVIPNAYPIDIFTRVSKAGAREKLGLPHDKKLILFGAQSVTNIRKGGDLLVNVCEELRKSGLENDFEIVLFGEGSLRLPLKSHCIGTSSESDLRHVYSACDVFVSLSREDVGPMTVVESMLCGTPAVTFPVGLAPELIQHRKTGYLATPFRVGDVIEGIAWCVAKERNQAELTGACIASARAYADPQKAALRHKTLYETMLLRH